MQSWTFMPLSLFLGYAKILAYYLLACKQIGEADNHLGNEALGNQYPDGLRLCPGSNANFCPEHIGAFIFQIQGCPRILSIEKHSKLAMFSSYWPSIIYQKAIRSFFISASRIF